MQEKIAEICETTFHFSKYEEVSGYFRTLIDVWKQINYSQYQSEEFKNFNKQLDEVLNGKKQTAENAVV